MVELSICDKNLFTKDGQNPFALNPIEILQQKPTSLLTVFRLLSANSQIKNIPRAFSSWYIPTAKSSCIWCFFHCLLFECFPSFCYSPFRDIQDFTFLFSSLHPIIPLYICFHFGRECLVTYRYFFQFVPSIIGCEGGYLNMHIHKDLIQIKPIL